MPVLNFEREHHGAVFRDAIRLTDEEAAEITPEVLAAMQEERFGAWLDALTNPPVATPGEPDPIVDFGD